MRRNFSRFLLDERMKYKISWKYIKYCQNIEILLWIWTRRKCCKVYKVNLNNFPRSVSNHRAQFFFIRKLGFQFEMSRLMINPILNTITRYTNEMAGNTNRQLTSIFSFVFFIKKWNNVSDISAPRYNQWIMIFTKNLKKMYKNKIEYI